MLVKLKETLILLHYWYIFNIPTVIFCCAHVQGFIKVMRGNCPLWRSCVNQLGNPKPCWGRDWGCSDRGSPWAKIEFQQFYDHLECKMHIQFKCSQNLHIKPHFGVAFISTINKKKYWSFYYYTREIFSSIWENGIFRRNVGSI